MAGTAGEADAGAPVGWSLIRQDKASGEYLLFNPDWSPPYVHVEQEPGVDRCIWWPVLEVGLPINNDQDWFVITSLPGKDVPMSARAFVADPNAAMTMEVL